MKTSRILFLIVLLSVTTLLSAQEGMFGYIDFNGTLKLMPEYMEAQIILLKTQSDYREEIERSKREFERQYIDFMLEQDYLSPSIVAKRQKELQLLMDNNAEFRDKVQSELETKRNELLLPLKNKLMKAVSEISKEQDLDYVIDTGKGAYLFINPDKGVDISEVVYKKLGIDNIPDKVVEQGQPVIMQNSDKNGK